MDNEKETEIIKKIRNAESELNKVIKEAAKKWGIEVLELGDQRMEQIGDKAWTVQLRIKLAKIL